MEGKEEHNVRFNKDMLKDYDEILPKLPNKYRRKGGFAQFCQDAFDEKIARMRGGA